MISRQQTQRMVGELTTSLMVAVRAELASTRGARDWGAGAEVVRVDTRTLSIRVPGTNGPSYFEIKVRAKQ